VLPTPPRCQRTVAATPEYERHAERQHGGKARRRAAANRGRGMARQKTAGEQRQAVRLPQAGLPVTRRGENMRRMLRIAGRRRREQQVRAVAATSTFYVITRIAMAGGKRLSGVIMRPGGRVFYATPCFHVASEEVECIVNMEWSATRDHCLFRNGRCMDQKGIFARSNEVILGSEATKRIGVTATALLSQPRSGYRTGERRRQAEYGRL